MAMTRALFSLLLLSGAALSQPAAPKPDLLWPDGAPGAQGTEAIDKPTLTPFLVPAGRGTGTAVVVCPGGGYEHLSMEKEGSEIARWLNSIGVSAFVLQVPSGSEVPSSDRTRRRAARHPHGADESRRIPRTPDRIGIMGFSAGGHLASIAGTHFDAGNPSATDPIDRVGSRPDFMVLCYPVISFGTYAARGSKNDLLGEHPDPKLVEIACPTNCR